MPTYSLDNNNSGGSFWIGPEDVKKLRDTGWYPRPRTADSFVPFGDPDNYFGTRCTYEELHDLRVEKPTIREAIEEFEKITGQNFFALGCTCCGAPFTMVEIDEDGETIYDTRTGGDYVNHEPQRPF